MLETIGIQNWTKLNSFWYFSFFFSSSSTSLYFLLRVSFVEICQLCFFSKLFRSLSLSHFLYLEDKFYRFFSHLEWNAYFYIFHTFSTLWPFFLRSITSIYCPVSGFKPYHRPSPFPPAYHPSHPNMPTISASIQQSRSYLVWFIPSIWFPLRFRYTLAHFIQL